MDEEWRSVVGFGGVFEVSNLGRVKSLARVAYHTNQFGVTCEQPVAEKILTQTSNGRYPTVCLSRDGTSRAYAVHRLVLEAFVGPCPPGMLCRHFPDRSTKNNRLDNLSWGTPKQNTRDRVVHGTLVGRKPSPETRALMSQKAKLRWQRARESRQGECNAPAPA